MTTYCPQCGQSNQEETAVLPLTTIWSRCEQCQFVWRSSVLDVVATYAKRRVGLARHQKVENRHSASALMDTSALSKPVALGQVDTDRVAQWLVSQEKNATGSQLAPATRISRDHRDPADVEEFFDQLDPLAAPARSAPQEDFYSFFSEKPAPEEALTEEWLSEDDAAEASQALESLADESGAPEEPMASAVNPIRSQPRSAETPLEASVDRALTNVEDLYDAFKRLEQQLGGMEKMCEELAQAR